MVYADSQPVCVVISILDETKQQFIRRTLALFFDFLGWEEGGICFTFVVIFKILNIENLR